MDLPTLLRKEALTVRRNVGLFVVLLILIPAMLAGVTGVYERTIPEDVPVGVVAADEETTDEELAVVRTGVRFFATPVSYDSMDEAKAGLEREEVYLVIEVPSGLSEEGEPANFTVVSDRTIVPFSEPANMSANILDSELDRQFPADVSVEQERMNEDRVLTEYLMAAALVAFIFVYAMVFVPYQVRGERLVLDRLQTTSRLETVVASKVLFYGALTTVPVVSVGLVGRWMGFDMAILSPLTLVTVALTFVFLSAVGLAILFALRLGRSALFANVGLVFGLVGLSSLVYPVGFFSTTRKAIARALPTHYATITTRSGMLRDTPATLYADYVLILLGSALAGLFVCWLSIQYYTRRR
ncbi:ABC transporter permease [Halovivax gelatinilyticus]|uniref:ABC transporter permease n=1 Tax=Halovivax gelatinilyticus TaxID=2961597 RepID=UPI0020CA78B5|nr:ABC transporter permease [Halovivax gelatinilyticus]